MKLFSEVESEVASATVVDALECLERFDFSDPDSSPPEAEHATARAGTEVRLEHVYTRERTRSETFILPLPPRAGNLTRHEM